jgi:hypothetical protein
MCSSTAFGPLPTDMLLQTRHSAGQTRGRRHPARHDPQRSVVNVGYRAAKSCNPKTNRNRSCEPGDPCTAASNLASRHRR